VKWPERELTTLLYLVPNLKMSAAIPLIPLRCDAVHRDIFTFNFLLMVHSCIQRSVGGEKFSLEDFEINGRKADPKEIVRMCTEFMCVTGSKCYRSRR